MKRLMIDKLTSVTESGGHRQSVSDLWHGVGQPVNLHAQLRMTQQCFTIECSWQWVAPGSCPSWSKTTIPQWARGWRLDSLGVGSIVQSGARVSWEVARSCSSVSVVMWHGVGFTRQAVGGSSREHWFTIRICWLLVGWARHRSLATSRTTTSVT